MTEKMVSSLASDSKMEENCENKLNYLKDKMNGLSQLSISNPTANVRAKQFAISTNEFGNLKECIFYVTDKNTKRGMAFSMAYNEAKQSENISEVCAYVGSMLCDVSPSFRSSVEVALKGIGIKPVEVSLPSQAREQDIVEIDDAVHLECLMDLPTVLVYFACCILLLFKNCTDHETNYNTFMSNCISELRDKAACDPDDNLDIPPFDFKKASAITTLLGGCSKLREDAIGFLVSNMDSEDTAIRGVCKYLWDTLSWSGINHIILMNDFLVKPQSPFLLDPNVSKEVDHLMVACEAIASHDYPQFYIYLASDLEVVEPSRFPTLIARAQEVKKEGDIEQKEGKKQPSSNCDGSTIVI